MHDVPIEVRGEVDERAVVQLRRCASPDVAVAGALCADGHVGYAQPIGGAVAYPDHVSVSGVGYDIACGNKAVATDLRFADVADAISALMDEIAARIPFGVGRRSDDPVDHPVLDRIRDEAPLHEIAALHEKAGEQLGTVGSGNHYVDLFRDRDDDRLWIGVHFGSRGFGHTIATGFLALAAGLRFDERATEGEMDSPPVLLDVHAGVGQAYLRAMELAGAYAYAGRDVVCDRVLGILGARATETVHNHHNFAWRERVAGVDAWVVRKGCTPAFAGQRGFVGATMGEDAVILEGTEGAATAGLLSSTVHGAGRVMSRSQAAGRRRRRWTCTAQACGWIQPAATPKPTDGRCPACGQRLERRMVQEVPGLIDWDDARTRLAAAGVELRGAGPDEAPGAYKRLDAVLAHHADSVRVLHRLQPVGVAMAGPDVHDPFKD